MSQSPAPWRALEDAPATISPGSAPVPPASASAQARAGVGPLGILGPRASWVLAGLLGAAALAAVAILLVATSGTGAVVVDGAEVVAIDRPSAGTSPSAASGVNLVVDVQGAVRRPGIVTLPPGARVADAIEAAGGYSGRVAADRVRDVLNLAALLDDGAQVVVPSRDDPVASGNSGGGRPTGSPSPGGGAGPVDLNRATATELDALPGVGPVTAAKIIAAREEQPFASLEDLRARKVLGAATLEKIKELVVVR